MIERIRLTFIILLTVGTLSEFGYGGAPPAPTPIEWITSGTQWRLHVKHYSNPDAYCLGFADGKAKSTPTVQDEFDLLISVLEPKKLDAKHIARLLFAPSEGAPRHLKESEYILELEVPGGQVHGPVVAKGEMALGSGLVTIDGHRILHMFIFWLPVDWIVHAEDVSQETPKKRDSTANISNRFTYTKHVEPTTFGATQIAANRIELERRSDDPSAPVRRVIQIWVPGEPWWRTFQRFEGDRLDLEAEFVEGSLKKPDINNSNP